MQPFQVVISDLEKVIFSLTHTSRRRDDQELNSSRHEVEGLRNNIFPSLMSCLNVEHVAFNFHFITIRKEDRKEEKIPSIF